MKDKIKKFIEDHKEVIVKSTTCVAAGALLGAVFNKKFGGHGIANVAAVICEDNHHHVQIVKKSGQTEYWSGNVKKV